MCRADNLLINRAYSGRFLEYLKTMLNLKLLSLPATLVFLLSGCVRVDHDIHPSPEKLAGIQLPKILVLEPKVESHRSFDSKDLLNAEAERVQLVFKEQLDQYMTERNISHVNYNDLNAHDQSELSKTAIDLIESTKLTLFTKWSPDILDKNKLLLFKALGVDFILTSRLAISTDWGIAEVTHWYNITLFDLRDGSVFWLSRKGERKRIDKFTVWGCEKTYKAFLLVNCNWSKYWSHDDIYLKDDKTKRYLRINPIYMLDHYKFPFTQNQTN